MQKNKLLLLTEILKQESDAEHPISTNNLIDKLSCKGISCDRRTLARDICHDDRASKEDRYCRSEDTAFQDRRSKQELYGT